MWDSLGAIQLEPSQRAWQGSHAAHPQLKSALTPHGWLCLQCCRTGLPWAGRGARDPGQQHRGACINASGLLFCSCSMSCGAAGSTAAGALPGNSHLQSLLHTEHDHAHAALALRSAASTGGTSTSGRSSTATPTSVLPITMSDSGLDPLKGHPEYTKICDLANGASGFVQMCTTRQGRRVAVKFIERGSNR